jgi:hypothetical protein
MRRMKTSPMKLFHFDFNFGAPRPDYLRHWLERLASLGYDGIVWELEGKVRWVTCPECVDPEAMTKDELGELLAVAESLGLENIPLLQTLGHGEYVLEHPAYRQWREHPDHNDMYCPSNPQVRAFLRRWLEEIIALFGPSLKQVHLGADEAYDFGTCPACREAVAAKGPTGLMAEHLATVAEPLLTRGIRPGIWSDMVLRQPQQMSAIPPEFVIWDWNYWDGIDPPERVRIWGRGDASPHDLPTEARAALPELVDAHDRPRPFYTVDLLHRLGRDVVVCSSTRSHGDTPFCGSHALHAPNVVGAARKSVASEALGMLVTSWGIRVHSFETQLPWIALAAKAADQPHLDYGRLLADVADDVWGLEDASVFDAIAAIGRPWPLSTTDELGIQWNGRKDMVPAPKGFFRSVLDARRHELPSVTESMIAGAREAIAAVCDLGRLAWDATCGLDSLEAWTRAGHHRIWLTHVTRHIVSEQTKSRMDRQMLVDVLDTQMTAHRGWLETWLRPESARKTAHLVHHAILEYARGR